MTTATDVTLDLGEGLEGEPLVGLEDFAEEFTGGAWPKGWYKARIIEGFQTRKGKTVTTGDAVSKDGASRNLKLCLNVRKGTEERNMIASFNYRTSDFHPDRQSFIKEKRLEFKGMQSWPDKDAQRSSLALAALGDLAKATFPPKRTAEGGLIAGLYVGTQVDVYLGLDSDGKYNEPKNFAKSGEKTGA